MPLAAGTRLGAYQILSPLGAGGMGEVYRARDTKLNRDVALKLLPDLVASEPDRLLRFEREAQVLASLNHPNVAHLYGFEDAGPAHALVMELVDGPTLAEKISRGPIPVADAVPIAMQIAEALEAAHEQGIVHRDLKPANVKVRADGTVKVLDFGLAKAMDPPVPAGAVVSSPTLTARATQMGVILGTAAYMAPEQAKGTAVDKRADIWAFGVVLYEMLTARCPFIADSIAETLAHVMTREVDVTTLPAETPPRIRRLIARCLVKDPKQRLRDIGDARLVLAEKDEAAVVTETARPTSSRALRLLVPIALLLIAIAAIGGVALSFGRRSTPDMPSVHLSIALPPGEQVTTVPAISPDGRTIAYAAGRTRETSRLYLRDIDSFVARPVDSSNGAHLPFFSPDSRSVAFFASAKLWSAAVGGGAPRTIAAATRPWGGSWSRDGTIVYVPNINAGLWRVSEEGGTPTQLTKPDGAANGYAHVYPQHLPGSDDVLFSFWGQRFYTGVFSPSTGQWREATPPRTMGGSGVIGLYAANGYLLSGDSVAALTAAPWSPSSASPARSSTVVIDRVYRVYGAERVWFNVSANGTAVYAPGSPAKRHLVWIDRSGTMTQITPESDGIYEATVSRDGRRVARQGRLAAWVEDLTTGTRTRVLSELNTMHGGWMPGDERIVVSSNTEGDWDLYTVSASGSGELKSLLKKPYTQHPMAIAPDGSVVYSETHPVTGNDLWVLTPDGQTRSLVTTAFNEGSAAVSPDGRHIAYVSDESGRNEVFALPLSGAGSRVPVSLDGGTGPVWSRDGREVFYRAGDDLISVEVRSTNPLALGSRRKLLDVSAFDPGYFHDFDVSADGQRFLFIRAEPNARPTHLNVIVNWFPGLSRQVEGK